MLKYGEVQSDVTPCCVCGSKSTMIVDDEAYCPGCTRSLFNKTANAAKSNPLTQLDDGDQD